MKEGLSVIIKHPMLLAIMMASAIINIMIAYIFTHATLLMIVSFFVSIFFSSTIAVIAYDAILKNTIVLSKAIMLVVKRFVPMLIATALMLSVLLIFPLFTMLSEYINIFEGPMFFLTLLLSLTMTVLMLLFGSRLAFVTYLILLNNEQVFHAFTKSWSITRDDRWKVINFFMMFALIIVLSLFIVDYIITVVPAPTILVSSFVNTLLSGWFISTLVVVYIRLINQENKEITT